MASSTASAVRSSVKRLGGELTPEERSDVRLIRSGSLSRRFRKKNPNVSNESVRTYRSRFETALELFIQDNSNNWESAGELQESINLSDENESSYYKMGWESINNPVEELSYPFPLRPDVTVQISNLPRDLKNSEVERITAFLRSLAEDFSP